MNKFVVIALFAFLAVALAAEEMPMKDEIVSLVEETVDVKAKASLAVSAREEAKAELENAFFYANMDSEWIQEQELLETKQAGSGYQELKPIMEKVDELEKKIRARLAKMLTNITKTRADCKKNRDTFSRRMAAIRRAIKKNNRNIAIQTGKIKASKAVRARSNETVLKLQKTLKGLRDNRDVDTAGYKKRLKKRMKEIEILHKANNMVCTDFEDFKKTQICKDILEKGKEVEQSKAHVVSKPLKELLEEADAKEAQAKEKEAENKAKEGKAAAANAANAKKDAAKPKETEFIVANDPEDDEQARQLETEKRVAELQTLLADSDVPERTFVPVRKAIALVKGLSTADADDKSKSLPELMVELLQRIVGEQKRETVDFMSQLKSFHKQINDASDAIEAEVNRQNDEGKKITSAEKKINNAKTDNTRRGTDYVATVRALAANNKRCRDADNLYNVKKAGREGELVNLEKLRSLLRVLQKSDLPKCPNDCTAKEQGKCIWKGMYGKDSFCACTKAYYGSDCNKKKCPGAAGVLYEKSHRGVCSRRGTCDDAATKGTCTCKSGYYHGPHKSCEYKTCPGNGNCNGRGRCDKPSGTCMCYQKYYGHDCSKTKCPSTSSSALLPATNRAVCSGRGSCNPSNGRCTCSSAYQGVYCQAFRCPNNCSGRGTCDSRTGRCRCRGVYHGSKCQYKRCPDNCSGRGSCNPYNGLCSCRNGSSGPSCHHVHQCYHTTVNWSSSFARRGWGSCPSGMFLVGLQKINPTRYTCQRRSKTCVRYTRHRRWFRTYTRKHYYTCYYHYCSHKRVNCDDLNCMKYARCARPCEGSKIAPLGSCYVDNNSFWRTFDRSGWSSCRRGTFMTAMLRNHSGCQYLHCIEQIKCCSVRHAAEADCTRANWWGCLDWSQSRMCTVHGNYFISGYYRTGSIGGTNVSGVHNLEEARACRFRRTATAPRL